MKLYFLIATFFLAAFIINAQDEEFKPNGKIIGEVFGDYYYTIAADTTPAPGDGEYKGVQKNDNAFALRRFNLGYDYNFTKDFSARLLLEGNDGVLVGSSRGVYVKYAYINWKDVFAGQNITIGGQPTSTYISDKIWGYRSIEKHIVDFRKLGASNDWGVTFDGEILKDGLLSYSLMIANGTSKKPENDKYKKILGSVTSKLLEKALILNGYFDYEAKTDTSSITLIKFMAAYTTDLFTVGVEPFFVNDKDDETKPFGLEVFGKCKVIDNLSAFGRVDLYNPDRETSTVGYSELFAVAGIDYSPAKNISIMPNLWINMFLTKSTTPAIDPIVVGRVTFKYKF